MKIQIKQERNNIIWLHNEYNHDNVTSETRLFLNNLLLTKYHGCWCPVSLLLQAISTHDIDFCWIGKFLSYTRKDFNYLCHVGVEEW